MNIGPRISLIILSVGVLLLSFFGYIHPAVNQILWISLTLLILAGSFIRLEVAILAILSELVIGGHGYLFSITIAGFPVSFRIALFGVGIIALVYHLIRTKRFPRIARTPYAIPFLFVSGFIVYGMIQGMRFNDPLLTFFDSNAYISILYLVLFIEALPTKITFARAGNVIISFSVGLALTTITLLGIYAVFHYDDSLKGAVSVNQSIQNELSQSASTSQGVIAQRMGPTAEQFKLDPSVTTKTKPASYRWLRDTGLAEISYISGHFFRVFFPSHIFTTFALFLLLILLWKKRPKREQITIIASLFLVSAALWISYSRSLWLGIGLTIIPFAFVWFKQSLHRQRAILFLVVLAIALTGIFFASNSGSIISQRIESIIHPTTEVASTHRIELGKALLDHIRDYPLWGRGFGTLVSFLTVRPNGEIITAAFYIYEWAYLDIAVKMGLLGLAAFLFLLLYTCIRLLWQYKKTGEDLFFGVALGFLACLIANVTTPIFTHPLGFGLLAFSAAFSLFRYEHTGTTRYME